MSGVKGSNVNIRVCSVVQRASIDFEYKLNTIDLWTPSCACLALSWAEKHALSHPGHRNFVNVCIGTNVRVREDLHSLQGAKKNTNPVLYVVIPLVENRALLIITSHGPNRNLSSHHHAAATTDGVQMELMGRIVIVYAREGETNT